MKQIDADLSIRTIFRFYNLPTVNRARLLHFMLWPGLYTMHTDTGTVS